MSGAVRYSALCLPAIVLAAAALHAESSQTDWSGGGGVEGPLGAWQDSFHVSSDVSWLAVPGQVALAGTVLATAAESTVADDADIPASVGAGDLDGDGVADPVSTDPVYDVFGRRGAIYWWRRQPGGGWARRTVSDDFYGAHFADTADVDGDGDTDVIAAAYYGTAEPDNRDGRFAWFENLDGRGGAWEEHLAGTFFWGANYVDAGDLDGDGDLDLVGASELTDGIFEQDADMVWFENLDGDGTSWSQHDLDLDFVNASEAHAVDLDGDGDTDVLGANQPSLGQSHLTWWENLLGDGSSWQKHEIPGEFSGSGYAAAGDLDGDGDADLMGGGLLGSTTLWWENLTGDATSWQIRAVTAVPSVRVIELGDVDGDGDLDALATSGIGGPGSGAAWWFENLTGNALVWQLRTIRTLLDPGAWVVPADVDGDGALEAVVSVEDIYSPTSPEIVAYELTEFRPGGDLTSSILDGGASPDWRLVRWPEQRDPAAGVLFEARTGDDPGDLGPWLPVPEPGTDLATVLDPGARYLQYRLTLTSSDPAVSPIVDEVAVSTVFLASVVPAIAGQTNTVTAAWPYDGDAVHFFVSRRPGSTEVPGCPGVALGLDRPRRLGVATAGGGQADLEITVPASLAGRTLRFQAVQRSTCSVSNVHAEPFD